MGTERDPWSGGGDHTRSEVREIFARHEQRARAAGAEERHRPLPGFLSLPGRIWRVLPRWGRLVLGAALAAAALLAVLLVPRALENADQNRLNERLASEATREEIRRRLVEDQRPRRATLPLPVRSTYLETAVGRDFRRRVVAGRLDGPVGAVTCRPVRRDQGAGGVFTCLAERGRSEGRYAGRRLVSGYRFRARVAPATGAAVWCKENPRPLHPDTEEFVVVELSRACTG